MRSYCILAALASGLFTSCATYQYVTVSSDLPADEESRYIAENDSVAIAYSFNGYNGPVKLDVRNKLDIPLYIDWRRSALILNDETTPYFQERARFEGNVDGHEIHWSSSLSTTTSTVQGEIRRDESVGFVAPNSTRKSALVEVDSKFFKLEGSRKDHQFMIQTSKGAVQGFEYVFNKQNTPFRFRSYLTIAYDPHFDHPVTFDHEFWVSRVIGTRANPDEFKRADNEYYKRDFEGVGAAITIGAVATIGVLLIPALILASSPGGF